MKAVFISKYGAPDVLIIREAEKPSLGEDEVLIRVEATVAAQPDCAFRQGKPYMTRLFTGIGKPRQIPGDVLAGVVEAAGKNVTRYKPGDRVYGSSGTRFGTNAQYIALGQDGAIAPMPQNLSFGEAAALSEGSLTALPFLRDHGKIRAGHKVLIYGAAGGVGVYAVQLARHQGARVTGVCGPNNLELVKSLGAEAVIDYTKEDFTASGDEYDIIFDAVGKCAYPRCKKALAPGGVYMSTVPKGALMLYTALPFLTGKRKAIWAGTGLRKPEAKREDLLILNALAEAGELKPVVSKTFRLEEMSEAHRYVETGHKRGSAVVLIGHG